MDIHIEFKPGVVLHYTAPRHKDLVPEDTRKITALCGKSKVTMFTDETVINCPECLRLLHEEFLVSL